MGNVVFHQEMEWATPLSDVLGEHAGHAVRVIVPKRGDKLALVLLAAKNAHQAFIDKQREKGAAKSAIERLQRALHLRNPPARIECYDISHIQGNQIVASAVRFEQGAPKKDLYRHYKIRTTQTQDDFKSMYEVVSRRARRGLEDGDLPDLMVIDGGKGQLGAARAALDDHGIDGVDLIGLAKSRNQDDDDTPVIDHNEIMPAVSADIPTERPASPERVFIYGQKNAVVLRQNSAELFLLTRARDEAHRFAITFHRKLRGKAGTRSALDGLPGIGPKRRKALLRTFGSVARIRSATFEAVAEVVGKKAAAVVMDALAEPGAVNAPEITGELVNGDKG